MLSYQTKLTDTDPFGPIIRNALLAWKRLPAVERRQLERDSVCFVCRMKPSDLIGMMNELYARDNALICRYCCHRFGDDPIPSINQINAELREVYAKIHGLPSDDDEETHIKKFGPLHEQLARLNHQVRNLVTNFDLPAMARKHSLEIKSALVIDAARRENRELTVEEEQCYDEIEKELDELRQRREDLIKELEKCDSLTSCLLQPVQSNATWAVGLGPFGQQELNL